MAAFRARLRFKPELYLGLTVRSIEECMSQRGYPYLKYRFVEKPKWVSTLGTMSAGIFIRRWGRLPVVGDQLHVESRMMAGPEPDTIYFDKRILLPAPFEREIPWQSSSNHSTSTIPTTCART